MKTPKLIKILIYTLIISICLSPIMLTTSCSTKKVYAAQKTSPPSAVVIVQGMVCDFCAQGLKKVFAKRSEISQIQVSLEKSEIALWFTAGSTLDDQTIKKLVGNNGISVENIERKNK